MPFVEESLRNIEEIVRRINVDSKAKTVFLMDKNGQMMGAAGDPEAFDLTSIPKGTDVVAKLIGEREFVMLSWDGGGNHLYVSIVGNCAVLVVFFDERSSPGLVRLRAQSQRVGNEIAKILKDLDYSNITDADIEGLF